MHRRGWTCGGFPLSFVNSFLAIANYYPRSRNSSNPRYTDHTSHTYVHCSLYGMKPVRKYISLHEHASWLFTRVKCGRPQTPFRYHFLTLTADFRDSISLIFPISYLFLRILLAKLSLPSIRIPSKSTYQTKAFTSYSFIHSSMASPSPRHSTGSHQLT